MALKRFKSMAFCLVVLLEVALAQPPGKGTISGTVTDPETGDPVRKAIVTLTLQGTPRLWAMARTDGSGRFQFDALPAGKYDLRAAKGQEGSAIFGAKDLRGLGDTITLGDGEALGGLKLLFLRAASVSGRVFDADGEPLAGVNVTLLRQGRNLGAPILTNYRGGSTDDRGEYHIPNVDPGQYYLRSMAANMARRFAPGSSQPMLVDQYFGGAVQAKDATPIHVRGGENLAGLDFRLNSEASVQVRGVVTGVPAAPVDPGKDAVSSPAHTVAGSFMVNGPMGNGPAVELTLSPEDLGQRWSSGTRTQGPEFRFQMPDVPAGRYRIEAVFHSGDKSYVACQILDLHAGSGEIILSLAAAKDLRGTVRFEGPPASRPSGLRISLARPGGQGGNNIAAQIGGDGGFLLSQVPAGDWQLGLNPLPPGFLKSAQLGDKDVRFTTFEIGTGANASLNIVVSTNTAVVEGEIDSESSKRAGIIVAPVAGPYHDLTRFYYGAAADDNGKFKLQGIAPGKYKIFAVEKMAAASFLNPEAVDQLYDLGEVIELTERATIQVKPKLIPTDRAEKALQ
jgi:protocatechuate 3,4-dioxygenase beta subunit